MQLMWHGTPEEYSQLLRAVGRNCACDLTGVGAQVTCSAHRLLRDQRAVDRLLFARRIVGRLARAEHSLTAEPRWPLLRDEWSLRDYEGQVRHG